MVAVLIHAQIKISEGLLIDLDSCINERSLASGEKLTTSLESLQDLVHIIR